MKKTILVITIIIIVFAGCAISEIEKQAWDQTKKAHQAGMNSLETSIHNLENSTAIPTLNDAKQDFSIVGKMIEAATIGIEPPENPKEYSREEAIYFIRQLAAERKRNLELKKELMSWKEKAFGASQINWTLLLGSGGVLSTLIGLFIKERNNRKRVEKVAGTTVKKIKAEETIFREGGGQNNS